MEMLYSGGNCLDMTVLERQRAQMKLQPQQQQQLSYFNDSHLNFNGFNGGLVNGDSIIRELAFRSMSIDPALENGLSELGCYPIPRTGFVSNDSGGEGTINVAVEETKMMSANGTGRESFKKRKADKAQTPKVVETESVNVKKIKVDAEEVESKVTNKNSNSRETSGETSNDNSKVSEVQKPDYIHVRARRGQATDSHSLAERVRREKISERMKYLQDLVPGCDKIIGKAGMLDEIINYVQSLQRQVEFLSMKLAAVNPRLDINMDSFLTKEMVSACTDNSSALGLVSEMPNSAYFNQVQQLVSCYPEMALGRTTASSPMSIPEVFMGSSCFSQTQPASSWETDLQNLYNVDLHQGRPGSFSSLLFPGANNLKMEM
ncbi:hypothetical protein GIB67_042795 [Kingdonia uniflora]|uniref:BHLH domain-containing protein n=1 Tax=Kingdonia uniflora TaxID=39325 RepID=A0A7J7L0Z7_9MAGN|nr:hypothetical protein GIB67_042795 [Kingdonia uniflora]